MKLFLTCIAVAFLFACSNAQTQKQERLPSSHEKSDESKVKFPEAKRVTVAIIDSGTDTISVNRDYWQLDKNKISSVSDGPLIGKNIFEIFGKKQSDFDTKTSIEIIDEKLITVSFVSKEAGTLRPYAIIRNQEEKYNLFYFELNEDFTISKIERIHGSNLVVSQSLQVINRFPAVKEIMKEFKIPETIE